MNYFVKKSLFIFFLAFALFGIFQFTSSSNVLAQGTPTPNLQCKVDKAVVNGAEISKDQIPSDTTFGLYIYCLDITGVDVSGTYQTAIYRNSGTSALVASKGVTATRDFNELFGNPFLVLGGGNDGLTGTTGSGTAYPVIIQKSGLTLPPLNGDSNNTTIHVILSVIATPLPTPPTTLCPSSFSYSPATPQLNQPFQVIFPIPASLLTTSLNGDTAPVAYRFLHITQPGNQIGNYPIIVNNGNWVVSYPAVTGQTNWTLLQTVGGSTPTCKTDTLFASTGGPSLGKNPCIDSNGDGKADYCPTAIGNIPTNLGDFATAVLRIALGISGGIVLILMVIGSIRVMTSSGDPQRVAAGRDMIVAALAGALFIAFSVMIMQFLGTAVVPIPGLTFGT